MGHTQGLPSFLELNTLKGSEGAGQWLSHLSSGLNFREAAQHMPVPMLEYQGQETAQGRAQCLSWAEPKGLFAPPCLTRTPMNPQPTLHQPPIREMACGYGACKESLVSL